MDAGGLKFSQSHEGVGFVGNGVFVFCIGK